jgi:hypothetical protein
MALAMNAFATAAAHESLEQKLVAKEKMSWGLAIRRDAKSYTALHAADFFTVSGSGVTDRVHSEDSAMDSNVAFQHCDLSDFSVKRVADNAVLITYHAKADGLDHGKPFTMDSFASSLWMRRHGTWLNVFYQATAAAR